MFKKSVPSGDFSMGEYSFIYTYVVSLPDERFIHIVDPISVPPEKFGRKYLKSKDVVYSYDELTSREGQEDLKDSIDDVLEIKDSTLKLIVLAPDSETTEGMWCYSGKQFTRWITDCRRYKEGIFTPSIEVFKVKRA